MIRASLGATPYALFGALLFFLVAACVQGRVSHRFGISRARAFLFVLCLGAIVVVTLTPSLDAGPDRPRNFSISLPGLSLNQLVGINHNSLNVLIFVPIATLVAGLSARRTVALKGALFVLVLPFVIEAAQYFLPGLGRTAALSDAVLNVIGASLGLFFGELFRFSWLRLRCAGPAPASPSARRQH